MINNELELLETRVSRLESINRALVIALVTCLFVFLAAAAAP